MKGILPNLFKTFGWSIPASFLVNVIISLVLYHSKYSGNDTGELIALLAVGAVYLNIIPLILTLPGVWLIGPRSWNSPLVRLLLYFGGPALFVTGVCVAGLNSGDSEVYLATAIIFLVIRAIYYTKFVRKAKQEANIAEL